jgi:stage II sporulation protein M
MKNITESIQYLKESQKYIIMSTIFFFIFSIIGFTFPIFKEEIFNLIAEILAMFEGLNIFQTIALIFFNNARASLISILLGTLFGILPLIIVLTNGYIIGFVVRLVTEESSFIETWRLLPHGIFEIPAILISIGLGLRIGINLFTKTGKKDFFNNLNKSLKVFIIFIVPLLIIAAIIEGILIFYF